jgi:hypothetical protein
VGESGAKMCSFVDVRERGRFGICGFEIFLITKTYSSKSFISLSLSHLKTRKVRFWSHSQKMTVAGRAKQSFTSRRSKVGRGPLCGATKRRSCAPLLCEMRRSSTYSGSGDLRASSGPGPSESLAATPFDHPGLSGARSWSASSLVLGCFLPRKDKAVWMTQALYPPVSFWPPEDQLLHYACTGFYGDESQSMWESTTEEVRELAEPREEATESDESVACKVPSSEVLVVAKVPLPPPAPEHPPPPPSPPRHASHQYPPMLLLPRRIWSGQPYERR